MEYAGTDTYGAESAGQNAPARGYYKSAGRPWCTLKTFLRVAIHYLIEGAVIGLAVKYIPAYGAVIDSHEVMVIAVTAAVVSFLLEKLMLTFTVGGISFS
jgi:hypothetical protein